jgi:RNA polymerase sigma factor (sigma-70 family)
MAQPEPDYRMAERQAGQYLARQHTYVRGVWGEDLEQEARISAWLAAERYRSGRDATPATWQARVVQGRMLNAHRALGSNRTAWDRGEGIPVPAPLYDADGLRADPNFAALEWGVVLGALLARLPFEQSFVLRARYWDDLSQQQVAGRLGCHQSQVSRLERKALAKLREWLAA